MAFRNREPFDLQKIQRELGISPKKIQYCGLSESELKDIYDNYYDTIPHLEEVRTEILTVLNEELADKVHSVRGRIKNSDHLIEKIIRNKCDKPQKYGLLNIDNYNKIITDLIGFRIIILEKKDWREVHNTLLDIFQNIPDRYTKEDDDIVKNFDKYSITESTKTENTKKKAFKKALENSYHAEKPVVYLTKIDNEELYQDPYLRLDSSKSHYRSIHYIIRYMDLYFEIQVRTLFEEGWLEFDHRIKYPYDQNNKKKQEFLTILNSIVSAADRLISFYDDDLLQTVQEEPPDIISESSDTVAAINIGSEDQKYLKDKLISQFDGR